MESVTINLNETQIKTALKNYVKEKYPDIYKKSQEIGVYISVSEGDRTGDNKYCSAEVRLGWRDADEVNGR